MLLDEVASTARSSWQIQLAMLDDFAHWPKTYRGHPAYFGYRNMTNILSVSLMTACYALIETGSKSYSLHHAMKDDALKVSSEVRQNCDVCFELRGKISKYRNNVVAHVNTTKSQSDWADAAGIRNGEIDRFLQSARTAIEILCHDNIGGGFSPVVTMPVQRDFREFCRMTAEFAESRRPPKMR